MHFAHTHTHTQMSRFLPPSPPLNATTFLNSPTPHTPRINSPLSLLLPHPAGGYLVFIALEALRGGKRLDEGVERAVQAGGFLLLMTAGVSLIVKDTLNLTGLGSMLQ